MVIDRGTYTYINNQNVSSVLSPFDIAGSYIVARVYDDANRTNPIIVCTTRDNGTANSDTVLLNVQFFVPAGSYYDVRVYHFSRGEWEVDSFILANSAGAILLTNVIQTYSWSEFELVAEEGDYTGPQGVQGVQGVQGLAGVIGDAGLQGPQGIQGVQGLQGISGAIGNTGLQGFQGIQGLQGVQGISGVIGDTGLQGFQGIQGLQGVQGLQGISGIIGDTGLQGFQGIQGLTGVIGDEGPPGVVDATAPLTYDSGTQTVGISDSPSFTGLTITGTAAVAIPHIHGSIAGNFYVHVRNDSASQLPAGTAVYATGSVGDTDRIRVEACDPTDPAKMPAIGVLETTLAANADGDAVILGELRPIDTGSYALGDYLYVGANGLLVSTAPSTGLVQHIGSVARVNLNTGTIVVGVSAAMARVGFTGAYGDLSGGPVLPTGAIVGTTDTQTLTNKTLGTIAETVFAITDGASVDLNPSNGAIQLWTLGANRTATAANFSAGASMLLCVDDGSASTLTWPTITWVGATTAPTLATTGFTFVQLWKIGTTLYGMAQK